MGFIERRKKKGKDKKHIFAPNSAQSDQVGLYIQELEARFGYLALQEIEGQMKMRRKALRMAKKRQQRGLKYVT